MEYGMECRVHRQEKMKMVTPRSGRRSFGSSGNRAQQRDQKRLFLSNPTIITILKLAGITVVAGRLFGGILKGKMSTAAGGATIRSNPMVPQTYKLLQKQRLSPDSYLLTYEIAGRSILGNDPEIPTCIKVNFQDSSAAKSGETKTLSKSYSPVSHPKSEGNFDLIVKSYPLQPGGGVGKYICDMEIGNCITATLKKERQMHGSPVVKNRWRHVGLIAGGTGIAPLLQLASILLESSQEVTIHLLFVNRREEDILGRSLIDRMAHKHPTQFFVTYSLTDFDASAAESNINDIGFYQGRGTVETAQAALPPPNNGDTDTMIFVCGKDGFVSYWGGPVVRGPPKLDGSKGSKIQGPLLGLLKEAGYTANQVFKY